MYTLTHSFTHSTNMFEKIYSHGIDDDKEDGNKNPHVPQQQEKKGKKRIQIECMRCVRPIQRVVHICYFFFHLFFPHLISIPLLFLSSLLFSHLLLSLSLPHSALLSLPHCVLHTLCFIWFYICIRIDTVCFLLCCRVLNVVAFHIVWASGTREQFTHLSNQQSWVEKKTKIFSHRSTLHGYASVRWMETNGS